MLPVNPSSKLKAAEWIALIKKSSCPNWMQRIFSARGSDFIIAPNWSITKADKATVGPPGWFTTWFNAASFVYMGNNWELTTGTLAMLPNQLSELIPDGVSIGKVSPKTTFSNPHFDTFPQIMGHDKGEGGITVPTQAIRDSLNGLKDPTLHYNGVIVDPGATQIKPVPNGKSPGPQEGALVIATQLKSTNGEVFPFSPNETIETLFHELFHAGQIDLGKANADSDPHFSATTDAIKAFFGNP